MAGTLSLHKPWLGNALGIVAALILGPAEPLTLLWWLAAGLALGQLLDSLSVRFSSRFPGGTAKADAEEGQGATRSLTRRRSTDHQISLLTRLHPESRLFQSTGHVLLLNFPTGDPGWSRALCRARCGLCPLASREHLTELPAKLFTKSG